MWSVGVVVAPWCEEHADCPEKKKMFFFLVLGKISLLFFWFVLPDSMSSVGSFYSESRQLIQEK